MSIDTRCDSIDEKLDRITDKIEVVIDNFKDATAASRGVAKLLLTLNALRSV